MGPCLVDTVAPATDEPRPDPGPIGRVDSDPDVWIRRRRT